MTEIRHCAPGLRPPRLRIVRAACHIQGKRRQRGRAARALHPQHIGMGLGTVLAVGKGLRLQVQGDIRIGRRERKVRKRRAGRGNKRLGCQRLDVEHKRVRLTVFRPSETQARVVRPADGIERRGNRENVHPVLRKIIQRADISRLLAGLEKHSLCQQQARVRGRPDGLR